MNLTQLKYFRAVCIYQSVSAAAEYLHIAQPSLSNAIKELESEFGVLLFTRKHKGMELTKEGEELFRLSSELLKKAEETERIMADFSERKRILRLGVPPMIGSLLLPLIYKGIHSDNISIQPEIIEDGSRTLMKMLSDGELDMIFFTHNKPIDKKYNSLHIKKMETVCCVSEQNSLSTLKSVKAKDLKNTPLVLFKNSFFNTEEIKKWFAVSEITPDIILQTDQLSTVQSMIYENAAAGFLFRELIKPNLKASAIPLEQRLFVDISLVWNKNSHISNSMNNFTNYIKNNFC